MLASSNAATIMGESSCKLQALCVLNRTQCKFLATISITCFYTLHEIIARLLMKELTIIQYAMYRIVMKVYDM
jgi:hypothetical protein